MYVTPVVVAAMAELESGCLQPSGATASREFRVGTVADLGSPPTWTPVSIDVDAYLVCCRVCFCCTSYVCPGRGSGCA